MQEAKEVLDSYKRWNDAEHVCCDLVAASARHRRALVESQGKSKASVALLEGF